MRSSDKRWQKWGVGLVVLLLAGALAIQLGGHGYFWRALAGTYLQGHATAHIDDASNFAQRVIQAADVQPWPEDPRKNQKPLDPGLLAQLQQFGTAAFVVAHKGAILHEQYFAPYNADSRFSSDGGSQIH